MSKVIMIQGTHSDAGKSLVVTALCRIFHQDGFRVAPFKAQNMSLNAGVGIDGGEMGRAQIAQAEAAGIVAHTDMNPVLLKPESHSGSQVILQGKVYGSMKASQYYQEKNKFWEKVTDSLARLQNDNDIVVIEGAGSPAEINLKANDIVNMRVALHATAPVLLVGDIDRGGVFAALLGTVILLEPEERRLVKGFLINKFRGDIDLLGDGLKQLEDLSGGIPTLGVIPYLPDPGIAQEDSVVLEREEDVQHPVSGSEILIHVVQYPHISNFDEFDALSAEDGVRLRFIHRKEELGNPHAVILPGSKMTAEDLAWMKQTGLVDELISYEKRGGMIVGICGGYQMMGTWLKDPYEIESHGRKAVSGLDFLSVETSFDVEKITKQTEARILCKQGLFSDLGDIPLMGYQIHSGATVRLNGMQPMLQFDGHEDGAMREDGKIWGCYLHGLFENDAFRHAWLNYLGWQRRGKSFVREQAYDRLAAHFRKYVNIEQIYRIMDMD